MPAKNYNRHPNFEGYQLIAEISADTFSRVLLAERIASTNYEQPVAIKWLHATPRPVQQERDSLLREIHSLKSLHYPHIVPILAAGFLEEDNTPYLVMEYAPNGSLAERLQHMMPLFHDDVLAILDQIGQALHYAHQWNITHGNLKPQNILFDAARDAVLTDFHLNSLPQRPITASDETSVYTAPEQLTGRVDQQSDLYALGCLAYEMFTGHKPFVTPSTTRPGVYYRTRKPSAPRMFNPRLPQSIENAIMQAIAREPEQRQSDIPAFLAALRRPDATGIGEHQQAATLPTLPVVITTPTYGLVNPLFRGHSGTPAAQAQSAASSFEMPPPTGGMVGAGLSPAPTIPPERNEDRERDSALALTASPAPINLKNVKQHVRHYLTVSVFILLTSVFILFAYFKNQRASFKNSRFFLSASSSIKNTWLSTTNNITSSSWFHAIGATTRHAWLNAINNIGSSSWLHTVANVSKNLWLGIINDVTSNSRLHTVANVSKNLWLRSLKGITARSWFYDLSNTTKKAWSRSTHSIARSTWFNNVSNIASRPGLKRPGLAFTLTAALLLAAMTGMLTLLLLSPHIPSGKSLTQATGSPTLSPQVQGSGKPTLVSTLAPHSTPATTATTHTITFDLTPIPGSVAPTTQATTDSSNTSDTSNTNNSSDSSVSSDTSTSSTTPTAQATMEATPTPVVSIQPTPTPIPPTPTPAPTGYCQVSYSAASQWPGGFNANIVITNLDSAPINNWYLAFSFPGNQRITNGWNARFFQQGNRVIAFAAGYNNQIAAGSSLSLGFQGTWFGNNPSPTSFTLNGVQCQ